MRTLVLLALVAFLPSAALAQERKVPEIKKIEIGYQAYLKEEQTAYKVGLWSPIYVEVFGGNEGIEPMKSGYRSHLEIETVDSEDVGTRIMIPVAVKPGETQTFMGYVKAGRMSMGGNEVTVRLNVGTKTYKPQTVEHYWTLSIDAHLYLTLGPRIAVMPTAVKKFSPPGADDKNMMDMVMQTRHAVFENSVARLPDVWFGYNGVDLMILNTESEKFLKELNLNQDRLKAIAQWVRRGGRLVIPVSHRNQHLVTQLLESKLAFDPPIPPQVVPPRSAGNVKETGAVRLGKFEVFGGINDKPFARDNGEKIPIARLDTGQARTGDWDVRAETDDNRTLMATVRYGLGQITYLAISFDDGAFLEWGGNADFLKTLLARLGPRAPDEAFNQGGMVGRVDRNTNDVATDLLAMLDNFDVAIIPFGYVALFIVLYILVVGPLDFILLKYVFKRLEWTWITFPAVVLGVSVIAYFAAYALKGRDLKINKIDIVDLDLRTSLDAKHRPLSARAYGQTFFTILSPRIQNYTIGLEPNPAFWGEAPDKPRSVDLMAWMGRPSGGPHEMRRTSSAGFFRKPYDYAEDASALRGVPIPVWTTKAFCASWEQTPATLPFTVDLVYHTKEVGGKDIKVKGTLDSHLGVDLIDCWLIYQQRCYQIPGGLKSVKKGDKGNELALPSAGNAPFFMHEWIHRQPEQPEVFEGKAWNLGLAAKMKQLLFLEKTDTQNVVRNHLFRPLDISWRITEDHKAGGVREAILFGRVAHLTGRAEALHHDAAKPLPTKLWLGDIPDPQKSFPNPPGQMNQETYVRVILPVRPAED